MNYVNANGQPLNIAGMEALAKMQRRPVAKKDAPAEFHKGWRVQGHPPGAMEEARNESERLTRLWDLQGEQQKAEALRGGERPPPTWNSRAWRTSTKKKPVRSRPYEVPEAARLCADMATKGGWLDIEVVELKRSKNDA